MQVNGELTAIGVETSTDKAHFHNFTAIYERFLFDKRDSVKKVLEIGVFRGSSVQMWERYFPNAKILGLDITSVYFNERTFGDRVTLSICDATDNNQLTSTLAPASAVPLTVTPAAFSAALTMLSVVTELITGGIGGVVSAAATKTAAAETLSGLPSKSM